MTQFYLSLLSLTAFGLVSITGDDRDLETLVQRTIKASGGADKLGKFRAATWSETLISDAPVRTTVEHWMQWPEMSASKIAGVFSAFDGKNAWYWGVRQTAATDIPKDDWPVALDKSMMICKFSRCKYP